MADDSSGKNIAWDAEEYSDNFSFVYHYGADVTSLLSIEPGGRVLDLGCGNGALTMALADSGFDVVGLDESTEQISAARRAYPDLEFHKADARDFHVNEPVDAVFSNAVFHWIRESDQPNIIHHIHTALKDNGELVFECGGQGNIARVDHALARTFAHHGLSYDSGFYFPSIGAYATLLEDAGFRVEFAQLFNRWTPLKGDDGLRDWIDMFFKRPFEFADVSDTQREDIISEAVEDCRPDLFEDGIWHADYVRLRMKATKAAS